MKKILIALPAALIITGCTQSQSYHYGPIIPIRSTPLPRKPLLIAATPKRVVSRSISAAPSTAYHKSIVPGGPPLPPTGEEIKKRISASSAASGLWRVTGSKPGCTLNLTRQPILDHYRASALACDGQSLAKITSWHKSDRELQLFAPGGKIIAKFSADETGSYVDDQNTLRLER